MGCPSGLSCNSTCTACELVCGDGIIGGPGNLLKQERGLLRPGFPRCNSGLHGVREPPSAATAPSRGRKSATGRGMWDAPPPVSPATPPAPRANPPAATARRGVKRTAFGFSTEQYLYFGGYPGAASLVSEPERWRRYVLDSLVETTIARDVLLLARVDKPALLRRLFELGCHYSGQILSYTKMLGQLHEAGNTTTLAHYLDMLGGAGLLTGLPRSTPAAWCVSEARARSSRC